MYSCHVYADTLPNTPLILFCRLQLRKTVSAKWTAIHKPTGTYALKYKHTQTCRCMLLHKACSWHSSNACLNIRQKSRLIKIRKNICERDWTCNLTHKFTHIKIFWRCSQVCSDLEHQQAKRDNADAGLWRCVCVYFWLVTLCVHTLGPAAGPSNKLGKRTDRVWTTLVACWLLCLCCEIQGVCWVPDRQRCGRGR